MVDKKQVEPFIIFSFWQAFLFGVCPGLHYMFMHNYMQNEANIVYTSQFFYMVSVFAPLYVGIKRLRAQPTNFSGKVHVVAILFFVLFDLIFTAFLMT